MLRVKIPNGFSRRRKLRTIGEVSNRYGRGDAELTTRQCIQLHWLELASAAGRLRRPRGRRASRAPAAAATPCATSPAAPSPGSRTTSSSTHADRRREATETYYGNPEWANLPRKHKYSIASCPDRCNAPEINCISLVGVMNDGREGFAVHVGGGLSSVPRIARDLGVFVPKEDARRDPRRDRRRLERGPQVPHVAGEGAHEVHGRRHRRRRHARARRGEARPHARALRDAEDHGATVRAHRRARAEAGRPLATSASRCSSGSRPATS